ncbi:MAG TPA: hypothetical protein VNJ08_16080 [Bacteriovoracaceae bacterium]|nr:hypothetical protein [Bacteriovoracaceae bacterium]
MDWKTFFNFTVIKYDINGNHPYFHSKLFVPNKFPIEDLLVTKFDNWNMTESEKRRLTLNLRKILHCHHYFNSLEFERISGNFIERLVDDKDDELHFSTEGGGVFLLLAVLKGQHPGLKRKKIICETSEIPIPIMRLPLENNLQMELHYRPGSKSFLAGFPSLWARPEVLQLFDTKSLKSA